MFHPFYSIFSCFTKYAFTKNIYYTCIRGPHNKQHVQHVVVLLISNLVLVPVRYFVVLAHCTVHSFYVAPISFASHNLLIRCACVFVSGSYFLRLCVLDASSFLHLSCLTMIPNHQRMSLVGQLPSSNI